MKNNIFDLYLERLLKLPLWVKQVIYVKLKEDMQKHNCLSFLDKSSKDMFSLYIPVLTFEGRTELLDKKNGLDGNFYNFLDLCDKDYSILEISLSMYLTMEEAAKYFMFCVEQKFIEIPKSDEVYAMAGFISGKLKTGEYLHKNKTLTFPQVQKALEEQKRIDDIGGKHLRLVEVLDTMNFVKEDDLNIIFMLQQESKKRFILDYNKVPQASRSFTGLGEQNSVEIKELRDENQKLKQKLTQLLQLVKSR